MRVTPDLPPYGFVNDRGEPDGYHVEMARAIAAAMHIPLEITTGEWNDNIDALERGDCDLLAALGYDPAREDTLAFSIPHTVTSYSIFTREGLVDPPRNETELIGKRVLVSREVIMHNLARRCTGVIIVPVEDDKILFTMLENGEADLALHPTRVGLRSIANLALSRVRPTVPPIASFDACFATRRSDRELISAINEGLSLLKENGSHRRIYERWFGASPLQAPSWREIANTYAHILVPLMAIILLVFAWVIVLRRQVRIQTLALVESRREIRDLLSHQQDVIEKERAAISREIHDSLGQILTVLKMECSSPERDGIASSKARTLLRLLETALQAVRDISRRLRPRSLDELGLVEALEGLIEDIQRHSGLAIDLQTPRLELGPGNEISTAIFRIVQEALTNVMKHAQARHVDVEIRVERDTLAMRIEDDGRGIRSDSMHTGRGFGLAGIRERVNHLRGHMSIHGEAGEGTLLEIRIPLNAEKEAGT